MIRKRGNHKRQRDIVRFFNRTCFGVEFGSHRSNSILFLWYLKTIVKMKALAQMKISWGEKKIYSLKNSPKNYLWIVPFLRFVVEWLIGEEFLQCRKKNWCYIQLWITSCNNAVDVVFLSQFVFFVSFCSVLLFLSLFLMHDTCTLRNDWQNVISYLIQNRTSHTQRERKETFVGSLQVLNKMRKAVVYTYQLHMYPIFLFVDSKWFHEVHLLRRFKKKSKAVEIADHKLKIERDCVLLL